MIKLFLLLFVSILVNSQNGVEAVGSSAGNHIKTVMLGGIPFKESECIPNEQFAELTGVKVEESQEVGKIPDGCITVPEVLQLLEVLTEDEDSIQEEDDSVQEGVSVQDGQGDGMGRLLRRNLGQCTNKPSRCHYTCSMVNRHMCRYDWWFKSYCGFSPNDACCTCGGGRVEVGKCPSGYKQVGTLSSNNDIAGAGLGLFKGVKSIEECEAKCAANTACVAFMFGGGSRYPTNELCKLANTKKPNNSWGDNFRFCAKKDWAKIYNGAEPVGCHGNRGSHYLGNLRTYAQAKHAMFTHPKCSKNGHYLMFNARHYHWGTWCCSSSGRRIVPSSWTTYYLGL